MKNKLNVGQPVYVKPINNAARRNTNIITATISKIGNKYFELECQDRPNFFRNSKFYIDTLRDLSNVVSDYQVYLSEQDILDEIEANNVYRKIYPFFNSFNNPNKLSLRQLEQIADICLTK